MNKKTTITNLVGMKQEVTFTEVEKLLISVIDNFILWYTTESDSNMAEEYIVSEHIDYNEWFKINKSKYNKENKLMNARKTKGVINRIESDRVYWRSELRKSIDEREKLELNGYDEVMQDQYGHEVIDTEVYEIDLQIERIRGYISGLDNALDKLKMLSESIDK
tara:strand:- start:611 stop:1102 length:492 start_codon:yes stop_codon:yes gene_type:complete